MKTFAVIAIALLVGFASAAPAPLDSSATPAPLECSLEDNDTIIVTEEFFPDEFAIYTSQKDIVDLLTPINSLNFNDDEDDEEITFFFIESDKSLFVMKNKTATKLLDNVKDFASSNDNNSVVYFAAEDGLYVYNSTNNKAVKYCALEENLIGVTKVNGSDDIIYILNNKNEVYKVSELCQKKVQVDNVKNAQQIVLDYSNNLYFYAADKAPYVLVGSNLVKISGLPENPSSVRLIRPAFVIEDGVPFLSDDRLYVIYANGTSEFSDFVLQTKPSAFSMEATLIHYYAYNKKIYEYNVLVLLLSDLLSELKNFLEGKSGEIQSIATRSRDTFGNSIFDVETTTKKD